MRDAALESVGGKFTAPAMLEVRRRTRQAIGVIAGRIMPGMAEEDGIAIARTALRELGLLRGWHAICVRFGRNTLLEYGVRSEPGVILAKDDIFFIDIGPLLDGLEGDGGATFVVGNDRGMRKAKRDVLALWHATHDAWHEHGLTGRELYRFAEDRAAALGWELNLKRMSGHRIGDFPHPHRYDGLLSDVDAVPSPYLWILEMHIRHPRRAFGTFHEDLMLPAAPAAGTSCPDPD